MLQLKNLCKIYNEDGREKVQALKEINVDFRDSEFVSILGQSGSGKTTLLNIIGGLDHCTSGDLIINGKSTKKFKDRDWDTYRNHSVGFVFQSYNLISHQTILSNVELALTLAGIRKSERRKRAQKALEDVGLGEYIHKKPNELSGGQMQRVAIARALVGDPDILLADEPTGALDSKTSIQIMDLLKNIAKDRLVIMVTHNADLAEKYSTRIIKLFDGEITADSNPYKVEEISKDADKINIDGDVTTNKEENKANEAAKKSETNKKENKVSETRKKSEEAKKRKIKDYTKKTSMNFLTALNLSFNNLRTKKGRTILTSFAGSIGIIGIALILSLSSGVRAYINKVEEDTLSSYPLTIQEESVDMATMMEAMMEEGEDDELEEKENTIYSLNIMQDVISSVSSEVQTNNLKDFKKYLENDDQTIKENANAIQYSYGVTLNIYREKSEDDNKNEQTNSNENDAGGNNNDTNNVDNSKYQIINPSPVMDSLEEVGSMVTNQNSLLSSSSTAQTDVWTELLNNTDLLETQYDVLAGKFPDNYNEVVLILDEQGRISDYTLYALGFKDVDEVNEMYNKLMNGEEVEAADIDEYSYDDFLNLKFKLMLNTDYYEKENGIWVDKSSNTEYMNKKLDEAEEIKVVGIIKPKTEANIISSSYGEIGYLYDLTEHVIENINESEIVKEQKENSEINIFTGMKFSTGNNTTATGVSSFDVNSLSTEQKTKLASMSESERITYITNLSNSMNATYESNLQKLGAADLEKPTAINIYPKSFEAKDAIKKAIDDYNKKQQDEGYEENVIEYTDLVGVLMTSITRIVDIISYVLIAFVAISLVVSSIMIGIITYISVLERTKEIGILRAIGASKKDVRNVFNAETFIIGLLSGAIGIGVTLLLNIPINMIIKSLTGVSSITQLPVTGAIVLIIISMTLTVIAGLIPSSFAARRDPVEALRTE